ncbi:MAG: phosphopantetheine-binding protein [Verrucomicrobiales bacterium]
MAGNVEQASVQARIEDIVRPNLRFLAKGDSVGAEDNLGELGLDSLASINLLFDLESEFGVTIPDDVLDENTFTSLARLEELLGPLMNA